MRYFGQCVCCKERFVIQQMPGKQGAKFYQVDWASVELPHTCPKLAALKERYAADYYSFVTIWIKWEPLNGTHNPEKACNGKCLHAKRGSCDCACGGANHGLCA